MSTYLHITGGRVVSGGSGKEMLIRKVNEEVTCRHLYGERSVLEGDLDIGSSSRGVKIDLGIIL